MQTLIKTLWIYINSIVVTWLTLTVYIWWIEGLWTWICHVYFTHDFPCRPSIVVHQRFQAINFYRLIDTVKRNFFWLGEWAYSYKMVYRKIWNSNISVPEHFFDTTMYFSLAFEGLTQLYIYFNVQDPDQFS